MTDNGATDRERRGSWPTMERSPVSQQVVATAPRQETGKKGELDS